MRVFINGFGRIGRSVLRAYLQAPDRWPGLEIVGINDIAAPEMCAYLFEYDSVFGPWRGCRAGRPGRLVVDGRRDSRCTGRRTCPGWTFQGVDLVMECTGRAEAREVAERGLRAGASRVLISGPSKAADLTVVLGANDGVLAGQRIVSNASCTTNALAPLAQADPRPLGDRHRVDDHGALLYRQPAHGGCAGRRLSPRSGGGAVDGADDDLGGAAAGRGAAGHLAGRIVAQAVRVPVASVSCVDFHLVMTSARLTVDAVNAAFRAAGGVIGATDRPLVSTDLRARPESVVMACPETKVTGQGMLRVFGWYDNEWGFSNRMLDMALRMG
jgi:glyceraldehyde 3-phosphate dehydrogenase